MRPWAASQHGASQLRRSRGAAMAYSTGCLICGVTSRCRPRGKKAVAWAQRGNVRIWYELEGTGPPVLLLHGGAARGDAWRFTGYVDALRDDFTLVLVDARGNGRSERPLDYRGYWASAHAADTIAVVDELELKRAGV